MSLTQSLTLSLSVFISGSVFALLRVLLGVLTVRGLSQRRCLTLMKVSCFSITMGERERKWKRDKDWNTG